MQEINQFLKRETKEFRRKTIQLDSEMKDKKAELAKKNYKKNMSNGLLI